MLDILENIRSYAGPAPKGAITSADQLWIGRHVWSVIKTPFVLRVTEVAIMASPVPYTSWHDNNGCEELANSMWIEQRFLRDTLILQGGGSIELLNENGTSSALSLRACSLEDMNIGGSHNHNFLFATQEDAETYLRT